MRKGETDIEKNIRGYETKVSRQSSLDNWNWGLKHYQGSKSLTKDCDTVRV